jgi:hypothetical protein
MPIIVMGSLPPIPVPPIVAAAVIIIHYAHLSIPLVHSGFVILLIGYLVLLAGNLLRGM